MFDQVVENGEKIDAIEKQRVQNNQLLSDKIDDVLEDIASQNIAFDGRIAKTQGKYVLSIASVWLWKFLNGGSKTNFEILHFLNAKYNNFL